jgi:hypothetical protein
MRFISKELGRQECYGDSDEGVEDTLKGWIHKCLDQYWRFRAIDGMMLTHKDCRQIAEQLSALNTREG